MVNIDLSNTRSFVDENNLEKFIFESQNALERVKRETEEGKKGLGWRRIVQDPDESLLNEIESFAAKVHEKTDVFIVCGIGGSYLGSRAVIDALTTYLNADDGPEIMYAGHHISGAYLEDLIQYLEEPKKDGNRKSVYLNVISKSGSTLETALAFRTLRTWIHDRFDDAKDRIICTTSQEGGVLNKYVDNYGYSKFVIPDDIGGRFSVLTPVGLLPIAVAGFDIHALMAGAREEYKIQEKNPDTLLEYAAIRRGLYEQEVKELDLLTTFEPKLHSLCRWLQQLFGESEGKEGKGVFPATTTYSTDLHSLGQMVQQGRRNLMETFITIDEPIASLKVEEDKQIESLSYLNGKSFHEINKSAYQGTLKAHVDGGVPVFSVTLRKLNEKALGHFIYFFELLTAVYVYTLEVNPFNQPGVEQYKNNIYELLSKGMKV